MKKSERSLQFKEHFEKNKEDGLSIPEMARKYGLSVCHAYNLVREIAEERGVPYDSLLQRNRSQHTLVNSGKHGEFMKSLQTTIRYMEKTLELMDQLLRQGPNLKGEEK